MDRDDFLNWCDVNDREVDADSFDVWDDMMRSATADDF